MISNRKLMKNEAERGNALFLVLIAVALFAALSYAITQSGRGGGSGITNEQAQLVAARIIQMANDTRTGIQRMTLTGTANILYGTVPTNNQCPGARILTY